MCLDCERPAGIPLWMPCEYKISRDHPFPLRHSSRTLTDWHRLRQPRRNPYHGVLQLILDDLQNDKSAWPFIKPVDTSVVQDYDQIIDHPMGMSHSPYRRRSCLDCAR